MFPTKVLLIDDDILSLRRLDANLDDTRFTYQTFNDPQTALKFLNDDEFTNYYAKSRQLRGKSKRLISYELSKKGITKEKAEKSFENAQSDFKTALEFITKRMRQFERFDDEKKKKRIISRLTSRGFGWDTISKVLKKLNNGD